MNFIKRCWIAVLVFMLALALPYSAEAQDAPNYSGLEGQVSFFEKVDGQFSPGMKLQGAVYFEGFAMGAFYGENKSAGPCFIWRALEHHYSKSFYIAAHLGASSDLWQGDLPDGAERETIATGYFEPRFGWKYLSGKVELGLPVQCLTMDASVKEWTFGVTLSFMPNRVFAKAAAPSAIAPSIDDDLGTQRAYLMVEDAAFTGIQLDSR